METRTQNQIDVHCAQGDDFLDAGLFDEALVAYQSAVGLLPEPKIAWPQSTSIYTAIGETQLFAGNNKAALDNFKIAMTCPDGIGNPLLHLRLGQAFHELYRFEEAADELTRAYMGGGEEIFQHDDPKFFRFLKSKIVIE